MYYTISQLLNNPRALHYLNNQYMQEVFNFKDYDIQFLKLFWQPDFDESWMLLDEPFIETWLIQGNNLNVNQLYQHILFQMFHKETDYKMSLEANPDSIYMVKGSCLKNLCIICNKFFRDFFIRLEKVAHQFILTKSVEETGTQIQIDRTSRQLNSIAQNINTLSFIVEEIIGERVNEISKVIVKDDKCDEVFNLIKLPENLSSVTPFHLKQAKYVAIRCLRKNYYKHLKRIRSYDNNENLLIDELFDYPVITNGIDIIKALKVNGVKTYKNNGVSADNQLDLMDKINNIISGSNA
jgi:hypothetical protein